MLYSSYTLLALLVYLIINRDVLSNFDHSSATEVQEAFRRYVLAVLGFLVTDVLWGLLDQSDLVALLYADTFAYYIAMAVSLFLWTRYVISYLDEKGNLLQLILQQVGGIFLVSQVLVTALNLFVPILFWIDEQGNYHAEIMRYLFLVAQIVMFLLTAIYTLAIMRATDDRVQRRHSAIGLCGLIMGLLLAAQYFDPLLPLYSIGYLLGGCVLHSFVVEDERDEYLSDLEELLEREREHEERLVSTIKLAYTDTLTGVKSTHAYVEATEGLDKRIVKGEAEEFGIVVFDVNGLKHINDTLGHETGDHYIVMSCRLICTIYDHSPVYRIGGDEFVALLRGSDYQEREELLARFDRQIDENLQEGQFVVSAGMATYRPKEDLSYHTVFDRADKRMYLRKQELKERGAVIRE